MPDRPTRVIGLGNLIMGDDSFGLRVLQRLEERWQLPETVELLDGGTWGMNLLPDIEGCDRLLLLDAINTGAAPGTVAVVERENLPRYFALKLSPHQIDIREVLAACDLRGTLPAEVVAMGTQPGEIALTTDLTPAVEATIDAVAELAVARLRAWGHDLVEREPAGTP